MVMHTTRICLLVGIPFYVVPNVNYRKIDYRMLEVC